MAVEFLIHVTNIKWHSRHCLSKMELKCSLFSFMFNIQILKSRMKKIQHWKQPISETGDEEFEGDENEDNKNWIRTKCASVCNIRCRNFLRFTKRKTMQIANALGKWTFLRFSSVTAFSFQFLDFIIIIRICSSIIE